MSSPNLVPTLERFEPQDPLTCLMYGVSTGTSTEKSKTIRTVTEVDTQRIKTKGSRS